MQYVDIVGLQVFITITIINFGFDMDWAVNFKCEPA
ncbi:MAG: hypothetical protein UX93_C0004G0041 [Microgenomates group bacterium GW2011_GWC1_47_20]|uniref:Uncharacterized protein n=1 Tax=Candidatus Amesbacteria bacterium GW2011_GWC2_45_19 TaxID=1618366 RepID=A0A0G1M4Z8_9BACT|nr:MAG: hypothetical protein UX05_C0002G0097 [Candidatus Amesbacteria bacterium GW2011_GWC2_45_19]KKU68970.1 MAG: hypothetical protein UX93_C0004G0041 [Microgenomates group bacterium GW2011_GWC1_47_20]